MHSHEDGNASIQPASLGAFIFLPAAAGAMAWGIRGQYGHETGAMIAGMLVGFTLLLLLRPGAGGSLSSARAVALMAVAIGFGGSMTYGQTVGLTHDGALIGNTGALRWGLFGLAVKGGVWIGFSGALLGIGLGGKRYQPLEILLIFAGMVALLFVGVALLNRPFDPENRLLPKLYFSDHWRWEPEENVKPRNERWGGLWFALIGLMAYTGLFKRDKVARNLALWGIAAGALGFPLGQSVQAANAWHPEWFRGEGIFKIFQYFNWWNMMETTFGGVFGAVLGTGVWLNRRNIRLPNFTGTISPGRTVAEITLVVAHVAMVVLWNFGDDLLDEKSNLRLSLGAFGHVADLAVTMGILPVIAIAIGRWAPYLIALPVVLIPIAGKTFRQLAIEEEKVGIEFGMIAYLEIPILIALGIAIWLAIRRTESGAMFARKGLLAATWILFALNHAFFHSPWPWKPWTARTPNEIIFLICALALSTLALWPKRHQDIA
jgi:hypothetical protein